MVAGDWVYSWQRLITPATASDYGYLLEGIVRAPPTSMRTAPIPPTLGVTAVDDKTLQIELEAPCPLLPAAVRLRQPGPRCARTSSKVITATSGPTPRTWSATAPT